MLRLEAKPHSGNSLPCTQPFSSQLLRHLHLPEEDISPLPAALGRSRFKASIYIPREGFLD